MSTMQTYISQTADKVIDGIGFYERADYNGWFENEYSTCAEPWDYSKRGGERLRHAYSVQQIRKFKPQVDTLLELGCSKGRMTELLTPFTKHIVATDISLTALKACKAHCDGVAAKNNCTITYLGTTVPGLPFADNSFDVVTVCDGLYGWWFSEEIKKLALEDVYRVLKPGGIAILTDYCQDIVGRNKKEYEALLSNSPLTVEEVSFLYDKPWYKMESLLKKFKLTRRLRLLYASKAVAKQLNFIGRIMGLRASNHIIVIASKKKGNKTG